MSKTNDEAINHLIRYYKAQGIHIHITDDIVRMEKIAHASKDGLTAKCVIGGFEPEEAVIVALQHLATQVGATDSKNSNDVARLQAELEKYKAAVKQLSFDLEMAQSNKSYATNVETERVIRKFALEQAAEYVMDYGIPTDGPDLEKLVEEIKKLHPTRAIRMAQAAAAMNAMFSNKTEATF